jgi:hypothetical protein
MPRKIKRIRPRTFAIYHAVKVNARSQRDVAREFEISQPRVSQAIKAVSEYLSEVVPDDVQGIESLPEMPRCERLYTGMRLQRMRLEQGYIDMMRAWQDSRNVSTTIKVIETSQGERRETTTKTRDGNVRFHRTAMDYSAELLELDGMLSDGSVNLSNDGRLTEVPTLTPDEETRVYELCEIARQGEVAYAQAAARRERAQQRRKAAAGVAAEVPAEKAAEVAAEAVVEVAEVPVAETVTQIAAAPAEVVSHQSEGGLSLNEPSVDENGDMYREKQGILPVANDNAALIAPVGKPTETASVTDKVASNVRYTGPLTRPRPYYELPATSYRPTPSVTNQSGERSGEHLRNRSLFDIPFDELTEEELDQMVARARRTEWMRSLGTREITVKEGRLASRRDEEW